MSHPFLADRLAHARIAELHADAEESRRIRRIPTTAFSNHARRGWSLGRWRSLARIGARDRRWGQDRGAPVLELDARRQAAPVESATDSRVA